MARFTIDFSEEADQNLEGLIQALGVKSKADVVRKALHLLQYVVQQQREGGKLIVENEREKSRKEVVTL
jgi:hypothetical protein